MAPAAPAINRHAKDGKDMVEWMPLMNRCWFRARVMKQVRRISIMPYGLVEIRDFLRLINDQGEEFGQRAVQIIQTVFTTSPFAGAGKRNCPPSQRTALPSESSCAADAQESVTPDYACFPGIEMVAEYSSFVTRERLLLCMGG